MIDAFEAQAVANILHIIAKTRYSPCDQSPVPKLEGRAEALAGTFNVHGGGQHAVGVCEDGAGARGGDDAGAGGAGGGGGGHVEGAGGGNHAVDCVCVFYFSRPSGSCGATGVPGPYWEWNRCKGAGERQQYLKSKLAERGPAAAQCKAQGKGGEVAQFLLLLLAHSRTMQMTGAPNIKISTNISWAS
jgi:hypothetical protein